MTEDRLTIGVVTPHLAPGPEVELPAMTSGRLGTVVSRTAASRRPTSRNTSSTLAELRASTEREAIETAAVSFERWTLAAVVHASTTAGYVVGPRDEAAAVARLMERCGVPAVASCSSAVAAMRRYGVQRVQLVHPPWFDEALHDRGAAYFRDQELDPVVSRARELPRDPARVEPDRVVTWVEQHVDDRSEAIFLAGTGFRAAAAIQELERRTGRLVVEANQAMLWGALTAIGAEWEISGYGRLLRER